MAQERSIRLNIDSTGARRGAGEVKRSLEEIRQASGRAVDGVERVEGGFGSLNRASTMLTGVLGTLGVTIGTGLALSKVTRETLEWERALTNLAKTVDAPQERLDALADSFVRLSEEIPVSSSELANLGASAGQLGIAVDNMEGFVEVMAALGVSSNLSADEAATNFARFANIMQMPQTAFENLGSVVVDLGNNLATTEKEIVEFGTRMAGAGAIAGLTEANVMSIGAAMSSVGVEAEAGGTAVQKVLIDMNTAVAQGNENLAVFAQVAGMSAQEFAAAWKDDAGTAFTSFVEGIGSAGDNATTVLEKLGMTDQRLTRAFLSLGNAGDLLRRSIEMGNVAWDENTALAEEAGRFYDTLSADLERLKNQFDNMAAAAGEGATPALRAAVQATSDLLRVSGDLAKGVAAGALVGLAVAAGRSAAAFVAKTAAALADARAQVAVQRANVAGAVAQLQMARATGAATGSMAAQSAAATVLRGHVEALNAAQARASLGAIAAGKASRGFDAALGFLASPMGIAIATAGLMATAFVSAGRNARASAKDIDALRSSIIGLGEAELMVKQAGLDQQIFELERQMAGTNRTVTRGGYSSKEGDAPIERINPAYAALAAQMDGLKVQSAAVEQGLETFAAAEAEAARRAKEMENALGGALDLGTDKLTDFQKVIQSINDDIRQMAAEYRVWMDEMDMVAGRVGAAEIGHGLTRGRDQYGRPPVVSETLMGGETVQRARVDAARFRELERQAEEAGDTFARTASEVARGVIDVADAFGGLDNATRRALTGITGLVAGLDSFDSSKGISLANLGSIVGIVGAVAQVGAAMFGQSAALQQNSRALEALQRSIEGSLTRSDEQRALAVIDRFQAAPIGDRSRIWRDNKDLLTGLASELGLTIDTGDINGSLRQLEEALRLATDRMFEFGKSLDQQRAQQDAYREIFDLTDPKDVLASEYGLMDKFASDLLKQYGAANLNMESDAGRATYEAALREIFTDYSAGTLDKDLLGEFSSGQEFVDLLLQSDRALDAFAKGLDEATRATTDIPKAINLALYQQRYATGAGGPAMPPEGPAILDPIRGPGGGGGGNGSGRGREGAHVYYITIDGSGLTGEQLLEEVERAAQTRIGSGGEVVLR